MAALPRGITATAVARALWPPLVSCGLALAIRSLYAARQRCRALEAEVAKAVQLRRDERAGRTAAERKLRQLQLSSGGGMKNDAAAEAADASSSGCSYTPVGYMESCFVERRGTPRQGMLAPEARAKLRIRASVVQPAAALDGLSGFSHVWLVYDFHENTNAGKSAEKIKAKVHPPGLAGGKIGLFATRTPHRPNPIGLTCARLLAVEGDTLVLGGADLIHGTPVLDVKPYLRHDIRSDATVPSWCEKRSDASLIAEVRFSEAATTQLDEAIKTRRLLFYSDAPTARAAIEQMLQLDIRSVHQGRGQADEGGQAYSCRFDELKIEFMTHETHVLVTQCRAPTRGVEPSHYPRR